MNKNKISKSLLDNISILKDDYKQEVLISCENFSKVKHFLDKNNYNYTPYRFINAFSLSLDYRDILILSNNLNINYIYPDCQVEAYNEKDYIHIDRLTENKYLGQGQTICFIDTGLHPHLDYMLPHNRVTKFIDLINKNSKPYDDNGHGTFVTGIACGSGIINPKHKGFAPLSNIISIKALGEKGISTSNTILDAMEWIYNNHKAYNIGIVCLSLGANVEDEIDPLSKSAEVLWKKGITVIAAAGNSGPDKNTIKSPGNNPNIITVGALDTSKNAVADFSSRGPTIYGHKPDLIAPAVNITSLSNSIYPYTEMSGTSVATPIVAGIVADIKSKYPNITNNEIKKYLLNHCTKITGNIDIEGAGFLNF